MKLANRISLVRMSLPVLFLPLILADFTFAKFLALLVFMIGSATDWLDGYVARKYNQISYFGKLMDPLADKVLVASVLISLVQIDSYVLPCWVAVAIIARDFIISGLRQLAMHNKYTLDADSLGKHKTAWQMIIVMLWLTYLALKDIAAKYYTKLSENNFWSETIPEIFHWLFVVIMILTIISGINYLWKHRKLYNKHV